MKNFEFIYKLILILLFITSILMVNKNLSQKNLIEGIRIHGELNEQYVNCIVTKYGKPSDSQIFLQIGTSCQSSISGQIRLEKELNIEH